MNAFEKLQRRGMIYSATERLSDALAQERAFMRVSIRVFKVHWQELFRAYW